MAYTVSSGFNTLSRLFSLEKKVLFLGIVASSDGSWLCAVDFVACAIDFVACAIDFVACAMEFVVCAVFVGCLKLDFLLCSVTVC